MEPLSYFSGGPAKLPNEVVTKVSADVVQYKDTGVGVLEISHRSPAFLDILDSAIRDVKQALNVPDNFKILFMPGGGTGQFAAVPLNLIKRTGKADYIVTGTWSEQAYEEGSKYGTVQSVVENSFGTIFDQSSWKLDPEASYLYYCDNETIQGVEFGFVPTPPPGVPLVCDMSSNIATRKIDFSKFGVIFAGAQKNIGAAGVTLVIIREDLLDYPKIPTCPIILDYANVANKNSNYNTPPVYAIHTLGQTIAWVLRQGGVAKMSELIAAKNSLIYKNVDSSGDFYVNKVDPTCRSRVNVVFNIFKDGARSEELEEKFVKDAEARNLKSLYVKGHGSPGRVRASLFNAITLNDVQKLIKFMDDFKQQNS